MDQRLWRQSETTLDHYRDSVRRLSRRILQAEARGDWAVYARLFTEMMEIAAGHPPETVPEDSLAAFKWVAAHDGGVLDEALRRELWRHPEILVAAVKTARQIAADPTVPVKIRREATAVLVTYGFDDRSLAADGNE